MAFKVYVKDRPTFDRLKALSTPELLQTPVTEVPFCSRAQNAFDRMRVHTLGELTLKRRFDLLKVQNLGRKSVEEIEFYLLELGLALGRKPTATNDWVSSITGQLKLMEEEKEAEQQKAERLAELLKRSEQLISELREALQ